MHLHHSHARRVAAAHLLHTRRAAIVAVVPVHLRSANARWRPLAPCILRDRAACLLDAHLGLEHVHVRLATARWMLQRVYARLVNQRDLELPVSAVELAHIQQHGDVPYMLCALAAPASTNVPSMLELRKCSRLPHEWAVCMGYGSVPRHVL